MNPTQASRVLRGMRPLLPGIVWAILFCDAAAAQQPDVHEIMSRLARNQDRAQELRSYYVYDQRLIVRFRRGSGKLAREEVREYAVAPTPDGTSKQLKSFSGKYEKDGALHNYDSPGYTYKDLDLDGELIDNLADDLVDEKHSRDGISMDLFPLRSGEQRKYAFTLAGEEEYRGRQVYRITFKPRKETWDEDRDGTPWAGEILVDKHEFEPVFISTKLARGLPFVVTTLLGTNLKGLGFQLTYEKFEDGVWFPVIYGAEFELKAVFFYKRKIAIALTNRAFQRTEVKTRVSFDQPLPPDRILRVDEIKLPGPGPVP